MPKKMNLEDRSDPKRLVDLGSFAYTIERVREYVWEAENVESIPNVDAILEVCNADLGCVAFHFGDECITMYAHRAGGVSAMAISSPDTAGSPADEGYSPSDAILALLSYAGMTMTSDGKVVALAEAEQHLCPLTEVVPANVRELAPHFNDVQKLFDLVSNCYKIYSWSD